MNFTSITFLFIFFPIFLLIYYLMPNTRLRNIVLLIASLYFYSTGEPIFVYVMVISIIFNYFMALLIHSKRDKKLRKRLLIVDLVANFLLLAIFKYTNFIISTINALFMLKLNLTSIPLPIGISFFTFQVVSYVLDVYFDDGKNDSKHFQSNIISFALYISMFPQLVAGPIVRYSQIAKEIKRRKFNIDEINEGLRRFIYGLSKKVLIANSMAIVADSAFNVDPKDAGSMMLILGAVSYSLQIYFDFSGYSDMAIGIGKMLGFKFPENFNYPYLAVSITDFWKRWHMTLSSWFKDYLYIPLGGSRRGFQRTIINLLIVWGLTGLWHGAKWTFVLWGLLYFALLSLEKIFKSKFTKTVDKVFPYLICRILTLNIVVILWIFFRSDSIRGAFLYIYYIFNVVDKALVNSQFTFYVKDFAIFYIVAILSSFRVFENFSRNFFKDKNNNNLYIILSNALCVILLILCTIYIVKGSYNPFIYFNF